MTLKLNSPWFEFVRDGMKIYEGRRKTPIIEKINVSDIVTIYHYTQPQIPSFQVQIVNKLYFRTFETALKVLPLNQVLPGISSIEEGIKVYHQYVSQATQEKDGIVMLEVHLHNNTKHNPKVLKFHPLKS